MTSSESRKGDGTWAGKRVLVVGMARSGRAAATLLAKNGARVLGTDLADAASLGLDTRELERNGVKLVLGQYRPRDLDDMDLAVLSPGVPKDAPVVRDLVRRGLPILSELELGFRFAAAPMAAVTGTNGKSTTVTVLGALIEAVGRPVAVAGNVGWPLSEAVGTVPADGFLAVEASSFQLEDIREFHPRAAAILNLTPDHLDRYSSYDAYVEAKLRIFDRLDSEDTAVVPSGDERLERAVSRLPARVLRFGGAEVREGIACVDDRMVRRANGTEAELCPLHELSLPGPHNQANIAAALCLFDGLGLDIEDERVGKALRTLRGLPHRLEKVGEMGGVTFYNDSKATNPDSLRVALCSFAAPIVLIAGGRAKGGDYESLAPLVAERVARLVLIGEAAPALEAAWRSASVPVENAGTDLGRAVELAHAAARGCDAVVLFSPGCASFDMFRDYQDRGDRFRDLVAERGETR